MRRSEGKDHYGRKLVFGEEVLFSDSDDWDMKGKIILLSPTGNYALVSGSQHYYINFPFWTKCSKLKRIR